MCCGQSFYELDLFQLVFLQVYVLGRRAGKIQRPWGAYCDSIEGLGALLIDPPVPIRHRSGVECGAVPYFEKNIPRSVFLFFHFLSFCLSYSFSVMCVPCIYEKVYAHGKFSPLILILFFCTLISAVHPLYRSQYFPSLSK